MLRISGASKSFTRTYLAPKLEHLTKGKGLPGLFSANGLQTAWFDRADFYTENLNRFVSQTEEKPLETIVFENAKSAAKRDIFNYASLLYNLRFSMSSLHGCNKGLPTEKPDAGAPLATPALDLKFQNEPLETGNEKLHAALISSFGSIVEFRSLLLNSNLAISGDGYTWLVARKHTTLHRDSHLAGMVEFDNLFVLNTYNSGSPFNFNKVRYMEDLKKQLAKKQPPIEEEEDEESPFQIKSIEEARQTESYKDTTYVPLLAIDASPKAWLQDYGVFGKQDYLERVWESIEWNIVEQRLPPKAPNHQLNI
ncbi:LAFE_0D08020g1_1 [Lachancea fermentati]|uniref:LAFE_0D08020g1_1 n=1 Tax=Lachancea fermentati TaxID=4955 RepID=A0A1G4MBK3_LACFM|nr:LAFE_0D08020g1_1 [Lachancea fermentati]